MQKQLIECVPNFSEGRDAGIIRQITDEIESVDGIRLLDVDPGKATNRTVVTFVGEPEDVIEAAFRGIRKAAQLIDMGKHKGEHPRMGATDVCPLIPIQGISMEETSTWAVKLAKRVGEELQIPAYLYEYAQPDKKRSNLSIIRAGEYEGFFDKIKLPEWKPDFGPATFNPTAGGTVIGARDFLIAYNVNLNTKSTRIANRIAFDVREAGRVVREGNPYSGKIKTDENGEPVRVPGKLKYVKAIGWYIEEYKMAQISINLTNYRETPLHSVFEECRKSADERGARVTGSELVGLIPLAPMLEAGKYFLEKQGLSTGVSEDELIWSAVKSMGLDELGPFDPQKKIIEYLLKNELDEKLIAMSVKAFAHETASDSPAPGGGSVAAAVGAFGVALGTMVANLSASKRGWEDRTTEFSPWAEQGQKIKDKMLALVDEDTRAFNAIMTAFGLPKDTDEQKATRKTAIQNASKYATEVPFTTLQTAVEAIPLIQEMVNKGNPNSLSDAGVGASCLLTAMQGAWMNVLINAQGLDDKAWADDIMAKAEQLIQEGRSACNAIIVEVENRLKG
ncbi:MAG: glutamate formimidoyltransferase [Sphingomonadales bacterium]|jgi:glutamate formiminotransferase/formiminotetrahydrofolate cyclodeaminase